MNNAIANRISDLRKKMNLTQLQLAEKLNISDKAISKWESGNGCPSIEMLVLLSELFGCTIDYLVKGDDNGIKSNMHLLRQEQNAIELYNNILPILKNLVCDKDFIILFKKVKPIRITDSDFVLQVETNFIKDYIENHYIDIMENTVRIFDKTIGEIIIISEDIFEDKYIKEAIEHLLFVENISISSLQRVLGVGFPRAGKIIGVLECLNFISKPNKENKRKINFTIDDYKELYGDN